MSTRLSDWVNGPLLGFDLESGGVDVFTDRIVTASIVHVLPGKRPDFHHWLINSGVPIPAEAQQVHGISTEHAEAHGVEPAGALFEITSHLAYALHRGIPVIAMNAPFDMSMLEAENHRHQVDPLVSRLDNGIRPVLDPLTLDRGVDRYRKGKRNLVALCEHYGLPPTQAHDSSADALMAVRLIQKMATVHNGVGCRDLAELHDVQATWYAEWAEGFADYLRKQGNPERAATVTTEWPLRPLPAGVTA